MAAIKHAILLSTADRYFALILNFATVALVSRLLTPAEIGVSVVGMAIIGLAIAIREFASGSFLIQRHELTREDVRGAFTVMLLFSAVITAVLLATTPFLADIYAEARLIPYFRVVALAFFLEVIATPVVTLLRREMAFGKVIAINMTGAAVASAVTVVLALLEFSFMSFAWAWLTSAIAMGLLALALGRRFWIFKPLLRNWGAMLTFGGYNGATSLLYRAYDSLPYLILGRILSLDAPALYSRSVMISQLPDKLFLGGLLSVVLPAFSAEARQGRDLKQPYLTALGLITALQWPALLVLSVLAYPVVGILLGDQWQAVAGLVQIIAIASLLSFSFELNYPVLVSVGAIHDIFRRALIVCPISAGIITVAAFFGLYAVAWSLMLIIPFQAYVSFIFIRRHIRVSLWEVGVAVWRSAVVALASVFGPLVIVIFAGSGFDLPLSWAFGAGALGVAGWFIGLWRTSHPLLGEILRTWSDLRRAIMARRAPADLAQRTGGAPAGSGR